MPVLLELFFVFLKVGAVSFGGGYGMISLLTEEVVSHGYLTSEEMLNFIAVAESTPGPIAINMATFIGASQGGFIGAILATIGVVLPSFIIILLIASVISGLLKFVGVREFLNGVRPVVIGLIVATGFYMFLTVVIGFATFSEKISFNYKYIIIFAINVLLYLIYAIKKKKTISPIILILVSALLGIIFFGLL